METSLVAAPADDEARLLKSQALASAAARALPGLNAEATGSHSPTRWRC